MVLFCMDILLLSVTSRESHKSLAHSGGIPNPLSNEQSTSILSEGICVSNRLCVFSKV